MKRKLRNIFKEALKANHPSKLLAKRLSVLSDGNYLTIGDETWDVANRPVHVIAAGKAALPMTKTLKKMLSLESENLLCITPANNQKEQFSISSSHPVPDKKSLNAAEKLLDFIDKIPSDALIFFALSGGASALLCKPAGDLSLQDINETNRLLLNSGATIKEINSVRKHLSAIKGGQILSYFNPNCTLIDLVISDVPGDSLEIIGSGPTIPDSSSFTDAENVLVEYDLKDKVSEVVVDHISMGLRDQLPETLKPGNDPIKNHRSFVIGSAKKFAQKASEIAETKGLQTWIAETAYNESTEEVAEMITKRIKQQNDLNKKSVVLFYYGESTVNVTGTGKGGRNQELALRGALEIDGLENVAWLSAGTDGIDGPTNAAGAVVDGQTLRCAKGKGLDAQKFLKNNDSYHFHEQMGTLLKTGPTGTNVMDVVIVFVE